MAHAGGSTPTPAGGVRLTFDQVKGVTMAEGDPLVSGTFKPANFAAALQFAPGAPQSGYRQRSGRFSEAHSCPEW
jgi:hypothetical protein